MTRSSRARLFVLALIPMAACATFLGMRTKRPREEIRVSHEVHKRAKIDCLACHEEIYDAKTLPPNAVLPKEDKCLECHKEQKEKGNCGFCHRDAARPATYPTPQRTLRVSHAEHIERVKEDCSTCHKSLPELARADTVTPSMDSCLGCHEHKQEFNDGRCNSCHTDLWRYKLRPETLFAHQSDFVRRHGPMARSSADSCAQCHDQNFCADCHSKTVALPVEVKFSEDVWTNFIHRGDFVGRHAIEARADQASCAKCHGTSFCDSCHTAQNLTPAGTNPRNPHPPGFSFPGSPSSHGPLARRDIASCASCHDQGPKSNCIACHQVGGIGGNPHPAGWVDQHPRDEIQRNGMCGYCH